MTSAVPVAMGWTPATGIGGRGPLTALGRTVLLLKEALKEKHQYYVGKMAINNFFVSSNHVESRVFFDNPCIFANRLGFYKKLTIPSYEHLKVSLETKQLVSLLGNIQASKAKASATTSYLKIAVSEEISYRRLGSNVCIRY